MRSFALALKIFAPVFLAVAAIHLVLGLNADGLLGAAVTPVVAAEPSLSSQNRFYGVAFALYGVVLYICSTDLPRFEPILRATLILFFLAGLARVVAWAAHGSPAPLVIALMASELVLPVVLWAWYRQAKRAA